MSYLNILLIAAFIATVFSLGYSLGLAARFRRNRRPVRTVLTRI